MNNEELSPIINIDPELIEVEIWNAIPNKQHTTTYMAKVCFTDIGMYINGITAQPSPKYPENDLWVQMPRYFAKGKWRRPVEVRGDGDFMRVVEDKVRKAVRQYMADNYIPTDEELEEALKLEDLNLPGISGTS